MSLGVIMTAIAGGYLAQTVTRLREAWPHRKLADKWAALYNVPTAYVLAMIARESSGNVNALGDGGKAIGLMQMWEPAFKDVQAFDPAIFARYSYADLKGNADLQVGAGTAYLALLRQRAGGDLLKAVDGYNRGLGNATGISDYSLDVLALATVDFVTRGFNV